MFRVCVGAMVSAWLAVMVGLSDAQPPRDGMGGPAYKREVRAYPTGDPATSIVLVERSLPIEVRRGVEFSYELRLINTSRAPLQEVLFAEQMPASFRVRSITPEAGRNEKGQYAWAIRELAPGASQVFQIVGSTDQPEKLNWCATVTLSAMACSTTEVVEPRLALTKSMPPQVTLCDDIPIRLVVSNVGSGMARNVRVDDPLPAGLTLPDGKNGFAFNVGDLAAGQSRELNAVVRANRPATYTNTAFAMEEGGAKVEASATTVVRQPVLAVTKTCPNVRYLGRSATFEITVQNRGDAPATDAVLTDVIPPGVEVVNADGGGRFAGGQMTWALGTIAPSESKTVRVTVKPNQIGKLVNTASVRAFCAEASATCAMDVMGIPAVLLEVVDLEDPLEVGANETYEITVTNQGSAVGTNIIIDCVLPAEQDYVSATGPTQPAVQGKSVRFAPLPTLAPKAQAKYRVITKGNKEGDVRFKVSLKTDQTDSPVEETESTHIY